MSKIDLLPDDVLIEIKNYDDCICAIGQLNVYSMYYPDNEKHMYQINVAERKTI